jgi:hypothetical protein
MATLQPSRNETKLEVWTIVVLGLVSLVTAWAAFQSSLWNGVSTERFARADARRTAGVVSLDTATGTVQEDRGLFIEYYKALTDKNTAVSGYIKMIMPKRLSDAIDQWEKVPNHMSMGPFQPRFGYQQPGVDGEKVQREVNQAVNSARYASTMGDRYNLAAVLFAAALFLAGVSSTLRFLRFRIGLLSIATIIFVGTTLGMLVLLSTRNPL